MEIRRIGTSIGVNTYLVRTADGKGFVVDPGSDADRILETAKQMGFVPEAQLLTHGHFDHFGASFDLQKQGIPVFVHAADAEKVSGKGNLGDWFHMPVAPVRADRLLEDGETVKIGSLLIRVLWTPGHSSGSVCYLAEDMLFSGDTLFHLSVGRTDFPDGNAGLLRQSIRKLFALDRDYRLLPGHDEESTLFFERDHNFVAGGLR